MSSIGKLRQRVTVERDEGARNDEGEHVPSWKSFIPNLGCSIKGVAGGEIDDGDQRAAIVTYQVETRYRCDITPGMRLRWGQKILNIDRVFDPDGRSRRLLIVCKEVQRG